MSGTRVEFCGHPDYVIGRGIRDVNKKSRVVKPVATFIQRVNPDTSSLGTDCAQHHITTMSLLERHLEQIALSAESIATLP